MAPPAKQSLKGSSHPRWFYVFAALVVVGAIAAGFVGYDALSRGAPDPTLGWGGVAVAAAAVVAIVLVSSMVKQELTVDADGVEERRRGRTTRIRWSEPHDLYYRAFDASGTPAVARATVQTQDGRRILIDAVNVQGGANVNVPKLVEQYSSTANTSKIQARIDGGEDVSFGVVTLNAKELKLGQKAFELDGPVTLQVERGEIKVGAKGTWVQSHVSVRDIANYACLLRAIGQVTHARAPV